MSLPTIGWVCTGGGTWVSTSVGKVKPWSGLAIINTTRSCVAFNVATASSCVTFSRFFSPD